MSVGGKNIINVFEFANRNFLRFADQVSIHKHMNSQDSSWDPADANALETYKNIFGQPYLRDDKFAVWQNIAKISPQKMISTFIEYKYFNYDSITEILMKWTPP